MPDLLNAAELCLAAPDQGLSAGRERLGWHWAEGGTRARVVMPGGSGKTIVGLVAAEVEVEAAAHTPLPDSNSACRTAETQARACRMCTSTSCPKRRRV